MRSIRARGDSPLRWILLGAIIALPSIGRARADEPSPLGEAMLGYVRGRGAESCPDEKELAAAVVTRLGYDPFQPRSARALTVTITLEQSALRATLELREPGATSTSVHRLSSRRLDCAVLHPALALAIALAIDPQRALSLDAAPADIPPSPPPRPFRQPVLIENQLAPRTPATGREPSRRPFGFLYGGALVAVAAGPSTTGGFQLGGGVEWARSFSLALELRADVPSRSDTPSGGTIELGRFTAQIVPCFRAFNFGFCALAAVGVSYARGSGFVFSDSVQAPYFAAGGRLLAELPLGRRVWLGLHADVYGVVTRLVLRVDATAAYKDAPANGAFGVTFGGRFGDGT